MTATHGDNTHRIDLTRTAPGAFRAQNARQGTIDIGSGDSSDFTPVELLLAALAGCFSIDVDMLTARRSEPARFAAQVCGTKVRDDDGNHLTDLHLHLDVTFPPGEGGDSARSVLPSAARRAHERICTVSRTLELATPVTATLEPTPDRAHHPR